MKIVHIEYNGRQVYSGGLHVHRFACGGGLFVRFLRWELVVQWRRIGWRSLVPWPRSSSWSWGWWRHYWRWFGPVRVGPRYSGYSVGEKVTKLGYLML